MIVFLVVMAINRLTTAMRRHDAHHGENLRFQHQRWENAWSYDKMVWSGQQYCGIHSKGSNATLSPAPVGEVQGTKGMVWGSCTAVNQYRLQSTGRGSRLDLWADSSARTLKHVHYIYVIKCTWVPDADWMSYAHKIRTIWNECLISVSWTNRTSSSKAPTSSSV